MAQFPITRQGYDCDVVDAHVADLETELTELEQQLHDLRAEASSRSEVAIEIHRIGEQTSAILVAAHDEAQQTVRLAQSRADTVIADAASYAASLTEEATLRLREIQSETASVSRQRERLIEDIRSTSSALNSVADDALRRFSPSA